MGYNSPPGDEIKQLFELLRQFGRRLSELERPTGSQVAQALAELRELVNGLLTATNGVFSGYVTAGSYVEAGTYIAADTTVAAGTAITAGTTISAGGNITTPGTVQADTMLNSLGAYNNDITATRRGAWWRSNGDAGYASSSMEKKVLVEGIDLPDPLAVLELCDTYFHYKAELDKRDNPENPEYDPDYHVALEWGSIAEWAHDLGLWQIVVYENHWKPVALHYELMGLLAIRASRHIWENLMYERRERLSLDRRVEALEILLGTRE